jgi:hypothetical protein
MVSITNCITVRANRMISGMREAQTDAGRRTGAATSNGALNIHLKIAGRDPIQPLRTQCFAETNGAATVGERFLRRGASRQSQASMRHFAGIPSSCAPERRVLEQPNAIFGAWHRFFATERAVGR